MRIGELSRRSGVSHRSLRHYEQIGLLTAEREANGYREYEDSTVERAATIHLLFGMGLPRDVVSSVLTCTGDVAPEVHVEVARRLEPVKAELEARIEQLTATHAALTEFLEGRR